MRDAVPGTLTRIEKLKVLISRAPMAILVNGHSVSED
jgi:hypothetical protein